MGAAHQQEQQQSREDEDDRGKNSLMSDDCPVSAAITHSVPSHPWTMIMRGREREGEKKN
jgi:hypothetical protein